MKENPYQHGHEDIKELLKAYNDLQKGLSHSFLDEDAFEKIIDYFDEREELNKALEASCSAVEQFPYSSLLLIKKADFLIANGKYHDAMKALSYAEVLDSSDINLYILKTDVLLALDEQEKAVEILQQALEHFTGDEKQELLFELADVYDDYEEFDKVFDCLKMILEDDPVNEEALYKICFWTDFTGRNEESIKLHQQIINEYPYSELAWFNLGAAYQGIKLYEKAIDAYKYATAIEDKFDYAYRNIGDAFIRLRKYREAIETLERVLELSKPEDLIYEAIGYCYEKMKNYSQARFHYRKASHLNPGDSKLYYKIATTYFFEENWPAAIKQLDAAMKILRSQPDYNLLMGECKMQVGDFEEAVMCFSAVIKARPKNAAGWTAIVRCLFFSGYYDEAAAHSKLALKATGNKPVFLYLMAGILLAGGKSKEAVLYLEQGLQKAPKLLRKLIEIYPSVLQNAAAVDIIAKNKKNKL